MTGIVSYGFSIPLFRLKIDDIASVWGKNGKQVSGPLLVFEKTVAGSDEDTLTLGFEASAQALQRIKFKPTSIGSLFVGSESHPYAVNPTATTIGEFLGVGNNYLATDLAFACKAATTGLILTSALIETKKIDYGLVVGADCAQAKPHDMLEYTAASGAAAFIIGNKRSEVIAEIIDYCSYSSDMPDFWRRDGVSYPSHGGRFSGEPAYFTHVIGAAKILLGRTKMKPSDFSACVFHMPNGRFPKDAATRLGFNFNQLKHSLTVEKIGNPYAASSLIGLINVLEHVKPNSYIFFVSYGSGAGADSIIFKTTSNLSKIVGKSLGLEQAINSKKYISYVEYLKMRRVI